MLPSKVRPRPSGIGVARNRAESCGTGGASPPLTICDSSLKRAFPRSPSVMAMSGLLFVSIQGGQAAALVNPYPRLIDPNWALQHARVRKASEASDDNENVPGPVTHDFNLLSAETKTDADSGRKRVTHVSAKGCSRQGSIAEFSSCRGNPDTQAHRPW
jgi:hypothetical protein